MNKKLFSAALFGALLLGTASTFVSCKDYDDDIKNLQTQITANKDAISQLQALVGSGNWVSSINSIENGFVVNMSNGQSVTVTGINGANGVDGKNGTEWTIGEDGMWYKDGVATEFKAVATDGKDGEDGAAGAAGVTAPSPKIDENGMWVVYEYDAEAGKFVEKTTTVSAQGTAAYAVKVGGTYELHIADETGKYQTISLAATADSFTVTVPAASVEAKFFDAVWMKSGGTVPYNSFTSKAHQERFAVLVKAFPEIANYKEGDVLNQGGKLPVLITPANVELNNNFKFALQATDGSIAPVKVYNPVKGMPEVESNNGLNMVTRGAETDGGFWTLDVELEKNKKGDAYKSIEQLHSLVITNEMGTVVKTPFAYKVTVQNRANVEVTENTSNVTSVPFKDEIDVIAKAYEVNGSMQSLFNVENQMNGKIVVDVANAADVARYGVAVEGTKLIIENYPSNKTSIKIHDVTVWALGLNGTTAVAKADITVTKSIEATSGLSKKTVILATTPNSYSQYMNTITWKVSELGMNAAQLQDYLIGLTYKVTDEDNNTPLSGSLTTWTAAWTTTTNYADAAYIGFSFASSAIKPGLYNIRVADALATAYVADAALTVKNPETGAVTLLDVLTDKNDVLQIVGTPNNSKITYDLKTALKFNSAVVTIDEIVDADAVNDEDSWMQSTATPTTMLEVNKNSATNKQLYKVRNFKAIYHLFNQTDIPLEFDFKGEVISTIYSATPANVISGLDNLSIFFAGVTGLASTDKTSIDLAKAVKAVYAAGPKAGQEYHLFASSGTTSNDTATNYSSPKAANNGNLLKGTSFVEITEQAYIVELLDDPTTYDASQKYYFTSTNWSTVWNEAKKYYNTDGTVHKTTDAGYTAPTGAEFENDGITIKVPTDKVLVNIFKAYKSKIDFNIVELTSSTTTGAYTAEANLDGTPTFAFADETAATAFATLSGTTVTAKNLSLVPANTIRDNKVEIPMTFTVKDNYGMTMTVPFTLTLKSKK